MKIIDKYWRIIILIIATLLATCVILLIISRGEVKDAKLIAQNNRTYFDKRLLELESQGNILKLELDSIRQENGKTKVVIIKEETKYETIKKSPVRTNYTNAELDRWLKSYESNKGSSRSNTSTNKRGI